MKTTVELPDALYRQAKAEAAISGRKLRDLIEEGLRLVVSTQPPPSAPPTLSDLLRPALGSIESGLPDLASNPDHLKGFGRDASHR
jgi:hypothetical protein